MPIMPGMFEMVLIRCTPETLTDWHRRFIELFEALYETGYSRANTPGPRRRWSATCPWAGRSRRIPWPCPPTGSRSCWTASTAFGVGQCQCRTGRPVAGPRLRQAAGQLRRDGPVGPTGIRRGWLRQVSRPEMLDIKREAEAHGMVNWMMNVGSHQRPDAPAPAAAAAATRCGWSAEFNAPGMFAPPHFRPQLRRRPLHCCGRCAAACPMQAIAADPAAKTFRYLSQRCMGCGLCVLACDRRRALSLEPVPDYQLPYKSWFSLAVRSVPGVLRTSWKVWRSRRK